MLIKFEVYLAAYLENISEVNLTRLNDAKISPDSIRNFMKPKFLHGLCILVDIQGATMVEEVT